MLVFFYTEIRRERMNPYFEKMKASLANAEPYYGNQEIHSVAEFLYWHYTNCNPLDTKRIDEGFRAINETMAHMSLQQQDVVIDLVNQMCGEFEKYGFCQGFHLGALLVQELYQKEKTGES